MKFTIMAEIGYTASTKPFSDYQSALESFNDTVKRAEKRKAPFSIALMDSEGYVVKERTQ